MDGTMTAFLGWAAPILSTVIVTALTVQINSRAKRDEEERAKRNAETDAKRKAEAEWRERIEQRLDDVDSKMSKIMDSTQATMRTELVHLYEKYMTRGWLTPEERAAWYDMHDKYSAMGFNGLIDTYRAKLNDLPDRTV